MVAKLAVLCAAVGANLTTLQLLSAAGSDTDWLLCAGGTIVASSDLLKYVHGVVDFTPANREHKILLDEESLRGVRDIRLQIYASPSADPLTPAALHTGIDDVRLYVGGRDLTDGLKRVLKASLTNVDRKRIRDGYVAGASAYTRMLDAMKLHTVERAGDAAFVQQQIAAPNWTVALDRLGDRRGAGWSGNLHVFNFLYRFIPLQPVSLVEILKQASSLPDFASWLASVPHENLDITFSSGPAPSYDLIDPAFWPSGRLHYSMVISTANPLEPKLREILAKLQIVVTLAEALRLQYLDPLKLEVEALKGRVEGNQDATAAALDEIKRLIDEIGA